MCVYFQQDDALARPTAADRGPKSLSAAKVEGTIGRAGSGGTASAQTELCLFTPG
jgi:hypothetical protein